MNKTISTIDNLAKKIKEARLRILNTRDLKINKGQSGQTIVFSAQKTILF